jgi:Lipoprotein NlpI, contains TPR repeats
VKRVVVLFFCMMVLLGCSSALAADEGSFEYWIEKGIASDEKGFYNRAVREFSQAIETNPQEPKGFWYRGNTYHRSERYELAMADYNQAIEIDPGYARAYNGRGNVHLLLKEYELATANYNKTLELDPSYRSAHSNRGRVYERQERHDLAFIEYTKALEIDPSFISGYVGRGDIYKKLGNEEAALKEYNEAIRLDSKSWRARSSRAIFYYEKGEYELAIADYNQAIETNPLAWWGVYSWRSLAHEKMNNKEAAFWDRFKSDVLKEETKEGQLFIGHSYMTEEKYEVAIHVFSIILDRNEDYGAAYQKRGEAYVKTRQYSPALADLTRAVQMDSQSAEVHYYLAVCHDELGDAGQAVKYYREFGELRKPTEMAREWKNAERRIQKLEK